MANVGPRDHKFGVDVKLHIYQPGDQKLQHGPRIKIFKSNQDYSITLNSDPNKMFIVGKSFLNNRENKIVLDNVRKYRSAFIKFWNDPNMTTEELRDLMDIIDEE
jgi:hypothetical protein